LEELPSGIKLCDRVQIFANLSSEIGAFGKIADAHLVLSTREGYNLVISEMAKQQLPVIANNCVPFRDRIISGQQGGWFVETDYITKATQLQFVEDWLHKTSGATNYVNDIASKLHFIRTHPQESREIASKLDQWVNKKGHLLRYHMDRLSYVLATEEELQGTSSGDVRDRVVARLAAQRELSIKTEQILSDLIVPVIATPILMDVENVMQEKQAVQA